MPHTRAVWSAEAVASTGSPSLLAATSHTPSLCSLYCFTGFTLKAGPAFRPDMILVVW